MVTGFINGCFDILHYGHIEILKFAKAHAQSLSDCNKLIVGINCDDYIRRKKREPTHNENERKEILESLRFVDEVIIFYEDSPRILIDRIKPDFIVKVSDYRNSKYGEIPVLVFERIERFSTTEILKD